MAAEEVRRMSQLFDGQDGRERLKKMIESDAAFQDLAMNLMAISFAYFAHGAKDTPASTAPIETIQFLSALRAAAKVSGLRK